MKYRVWLDILKAVPLFKGIDESEVEAILQCIGAEERMVQKSDFVLFAGDKVRHIGIVLRGQLHMLHENFDGKRSLLAALMPGEIYAEVPCCADIEESPVSVVAKTDAVILTLDFPRIIRSCSNACGFHGKLIENMLRVVANKNLHLQNRMEIVSMKSVRDKVLHYLESFAPEQGPNIVIPFNREELASFLCVERSALSHELARMKADGLIEYRKNQFYLKTCNVGS